MNWEKIGQAVDTLIIRRPDDSFTIGEFAAQFKINVERARKVIAQREAEGVFAGTPRDGKRQRYYWLVEDKHGVDSSARGEGEKAEVGCRGRGASRQR